MDNPHQQHQCPYCPLVFHAKTELGDHVGTDHPTVHARYVTGHEPAPEAAPVVHRAPRPRPFVVAAPPGVSPAP